MKVLKSRFFIFILGGIIFSSITALAVIKIDSTNVVYHDTTNVKDALDDLYDDYLGMHGDYVELQSNYTDLQTSYNTLQSNNTTLQSNYTTLQGNYNTLQTNYNNLSNLANTSTASIATTCSSQNGNTCNLTAVVGKVYFCVTNTRKGVNSAHSVTGAQVLYSAEDGGMLDYVYSTHRFFIKATSTNVTFTINGAEGMANVCYSIINTK